MYQLTGDGHTDIRSDTYGLILGIRIFATFRVVAMNTRNGGAGIRNIITDARDDGLNFCLPVMNIGNNSVLIRDTWIGARIDYMYVCPKLGLESGGQ